MLVMKSGRPVSDVSVVTLFPVFDFICLITGKYLSQIYVLLNIDNIFIAKFRSFGKRFLQKIFQRVSWRIFLFFLIDEDQIEGHTTLAEGLMTGSNVISMGLLNNSWQF